MCILGEHEGERTVWRNREGLTFYNVQLAPDQVEASLDNEGDSGTICMCNGGGDVVVMGGEEYIVGVNIA